MSDWTGSDLEAIGGATELHVASRRRDDTLRSYVTIWGVRVGDDLYVRSAYGADNPWFRRAEKAGAGRVRADGLERDVTFTPLDPTSSAHSRIDAAYHDKYDLYGPRIVGSVVGEHATRVTLRLDPQNHTQP
ncbi:DUF2255 family protein [Nocardia salmonicida]|uniref:DUF2255 family protein n=1 Tax=Nocardia salmonicida TaxID=53431 RepID=UPI00364703C7